MLNVNNKDTRTTSLSIIQGLKPIAQKTFICSESIIEILGKYVQYVQS